MKKLFVKLFAAVLIAITVFAVTVQMKFSSDQKQVYQAPYFTIKDEVAKADVALGKRLYAVRAGCIDCHGENLAGKMVMENAPMGSIYGANITPALLKDWSDEEIARAIRYGVHRTGRSLQFMPSFDYVSLSKGDIAALVAYVKSVPAVNSPSHANAFGPVSKMLSFFGKMPVMFPAKVLDLTAGFADKPEEGPTKEFGQYLAQSCVGCHNANYTGGKIPGGDPSWPEAANIRLGANTVWNEANFKEMLATGISPISKKPLRLPMPVKLLAQMNEVEQKALWEYLSSLK